ncbi:MAG: hypothetical protein RSB41_01400 [Bacilli bacterium]
MNKIKLLLLPLFLILLSGCSINYELNINKDNTVKESITPTVELSTIKVYYNTALEFFDAQYKKYIESSSLYEGYKYTQKESTQTSSTYEFSKTYNDIKEYLNSPSIKEIYQTVEYKETEKGLEVKLTDFNDVFINVSQDPTNKLKEPINIVIKSDYILKNTNASLRDKTKGIYTWKIDSKTEYPSIEFTVTNKQNIVSTYFNYILISIIVIIVLVITFLGINILEKSRNSNTI